MTTDQTARLEWRDGAIPISTRFDDPYFSLENGLEETRHTFLGGNELPTRFAPGFHIAELGFGTGLNALASLLAWRASGTTGPLRFTSFEAFPMAACDMDQALAAFPEAHAIAAPMIAAWGSLDKTPGTRVMELPDLILTVVIGDAQQTLPAWEQQADAWYLDGFSPAKNPELWNPELMAAVGTHTRSGGSCATYTAAGHVRRSLQAAGFDVQRVPGFGRKRHMTVGVRTATTDTGTPDTSPNDTGTDSTSDTAKTGSDTGPSATNRTPQP
ncbi:tRNA (5-methylaminomethyl-2-thiouridine)(34)-methyltransferase MnmD [Candidatus Halocynthiibacter alkanivorans]|uniref:tRNA (5-methylaminomethyl-2-thiouridine)(34)-methyltransferase MnmD n=1 Tax=Candidatus Halocynthiibacter alkanivorans TaxID=2267619 RepID=UPI000DF16525